MYPMTMTYFLNHNELIFLFQDIIGRVRNRETTPCRPEIFSDVPEVSTTVVKLMQLCWIDNEADRPTFGNIRSYIKKNIKGM